jgi:DNA-binding IclR family transcriptional regulator
MSKPGVHRVLATLREVGWAEQVEHTRKYRLSLRVWELGIRALEHLPVYHLARPLLERLAREAGSTANLSIYDRGTMLYVVFVLFEGDQTAWVPSALRAPPHSTAGGKVAMAFGLDAEGSPESGELVAVTSRTVTDRSLLEEELEQTRRRGYAVNEEGHTENVCAVAAPVFDANGAYFASISASSRAATLSSAWVEQVAPLVLECAAHLSLALGHRPRAGLGTQLG